MAFFHKNSNKANLRRGQIITTFGPGAIVNLEAGSFIAMDIDSWPKNDDKNVIYEERLQNRLKVKYFREPPSSESFPKGLPYRRFPKWLFCPKCRVLKTYDKWTVDEDRKYLTTPWCPDCRRPLVPMSLLVACRKGHIDEFPWAQWVPHKDASCGSNPTLKYNTSLAGAGLAGSKIECLSCHKDRSLQGAFSKDAFDTRCTGIKPWSQDAPEPCGERLKTVQRGGSNVYFPKIVSSITIPPFTDTMFDAIKETEAWTALVSSEGIVEIDDTMRDKFIQKIAVEVRQPFDEVKSCIDKIESAADDSKVLEEDYRFDEYNAFHGNYDKKSNSNKDFEVVKGIFSESYADYGIKNIFLVKSLREVRALVGFTRLRPIETDMDLSDEASDDASELVSLTNRPGKHASWKPAVEVRGEGIFIALDSQKINAWAKQEQIIERINKLNRNYEDSCKSRKKAYKPISAKYVLLHTLSHLLIRQLSYESGYSSASLRERIYSNSLENDTHEMQGILIYTAAGDADGTLGGLVRQANPERFSAVLEALKESSHWCANDPLCIESKGQGYESLNLAACYACGLLSETSCEDFNRFLDRAFVAGTHEFQNIGFFDFHL